MPAEKIRSLVVMCRRLDRPHGGAALRNLQNVRALATLGPVDVISIGPAEPPAVAVPGVRHYEHVARGGHGSLASRLWGKRWILDATAHPMVAALHQAPAIAAVRRRLQAATYDVAVAEELALAAFLPDLKRACRLTVFDAHNVESALSGDMASSQRAGWKRRLMDQRLAQAEQYFAKLAGRIWTCSAGDRDGFSSLTNHAVPIDVVPNAIDVDSYAQPDRAHEADDWSGETLTLTYLGAYSYYPNEQAALELIDEVLPLVQSRGIPARVRLIGANPTPAILAAAAGRDDVEVTGPVESVLPYLKERCLIVLPIRLGGGTRLKILEAFAASRPVISTAKGAEGIEAADGKHLLIRESAAEIAAAAASLWNDRDLRARLCGDALRLVSEQYSLQSTAARIRASVEAALGA